MEHDKPTIDPKRAAAALRKIRNHTNSTPNSIASTGLDGEELIGFMTGQFVEKVRRSYEPLSEEYRREMGRKALFDRMMLGDELRELDTQARTLGYKRTQSARDWILRVVSEGARFHKDAFYENAFAVDEDPVVVKDLMQASDDNQGLFENDTDEPWPAERESVLLVDLDDTVRRLAQEGRLEPITAQALLIAFGKVWSDYPVKPIENSVIVALQSVQRMRTLRYESDGPLIAFASAYLDSMTQKGMPSKLAAPTSDQIKQAFNSYSESAWEVLTIGFDKADDPRALAETAVAQHLDRMYPEKKK